MKKTVLIVIGVTFIGFFSFLFVGYLFTQQLINETTGKIEASTVNEYIKNEVTITDTLPTPVKKYFQLVISPGAGNPQIVHTELKGEFKLEQNTDWREATAEQYYSTVMPGFVWIGDLKINSFFFMKAVDSYLNGKGGMIIKLNSCITITDVRSDQVNQSALVRFISEAVLFPTALLPSEKLTWSAVDSSTANLRFSNDGITVNAVCSFDSEGKIQKIETMDKFRTTKIGYTKTKHTIHLDDYKKFDGFLIPTKLVYEWNLPGENFQYGKFSITKIDYK
ncbi:MAG: hypothetical protein K9J16_14340 [Melioribacteraceae bacterium]|nr:hypothetical protein [Melioribacteraceae bacterium]MCF8354435.1 hypothetical protein [Melioribacteraceae bacterium]MCF8394045.1 hypothetical protein [Melioribacteraceae bacterium]MCF8419811.1 hypothetical protein [Melioribacteraceae bacterium]